MLDLKNLNNKQHLSNKKTKQNKQNPQLLKTIRKTNHYCGTHKIGKNNKKYVELI